MVNQFYPPPPIDPLRRLSVRDGLIVNAERWQLAHQYHRHRQNIHYQSLNEPGIVRGLGVRVIQPPKGCSPKYGKLKGCWLEIQPGIAIDVEGNPIVIDEKIDRSFFFAIPSISNKKSEDEIVVYLVISYEDNPTLIEEEGWQEREWFKFDQQLNPPTETQIELCRIKLLVEDIERNIKLNQFQLKYPQDVYFPEANEIDLRFRPSAKVRPQALINVATTDIQSNENFICLMQSLNALYPSLSGNTEVENINLEEKLDLKNTDLLHIPYGEIHDLDRNNPIVVALNHYINKQGGVILIEEKNNQPHLEEVLQGKIEELFDISQELGQDWHDYSKKHPFKNQPFLFTALPQWIRNIHYFSGIIIVFGDFSSEWGGVMRTPGENKNLSRNDIRTAQELGINILNFAYKRRNMMKLLYFDN